MLFAVLAIVGRSLFLPFNWVQHYRIDFGGQISALSNYNVAGTLNVTEFELDGCPPESQPRGLCGAMGIFAPAARNEFQ